MGGMVTIFDPQGNEGRIPQERLTDAVKAGAKPAITVKAPDGSLGNIPADRMQDAVKAGAHIVPLQTQENQHPGFWHALYSDVSGMASGAYHAAVDPLTDTHEDLVRKLHEEQASDAAAEGSTERQAHGALYRNIGVPAAETVGLNVPGMEQSAAEGDVAGVAGHATAPLAVLAATEGAARAPGVVSSALDTSAGEAVTAGAKAALKKLPAAAIKRIPYVGKVAGDVADAARTAYNQAKNARAVSAAPGASAADELEGVTSPQTASAGEVQEVEPSPATQAVAPPAPKVTPQAVEQQLNNALGGKPLQPNVSLKNQVPGRLPEGFAPLESSALKGYKYDSGAKEFETITQGGQHYVYGDVSPEDAQAFQDAKSKGQAWQDIRKNPLVAKVVNGKRIAVKPARTVVVDPTTGRPEFSDAVKKPASGDLTDILTQSLRAVKASAGND